MKKIRDNFGKFFVAIPPPFLKHIEAARDMISMNKGTFFLIIGVCFLFGWIYANRNRDH